MASAMVARNDDFGDDTAGAHTGWEGKDFRSVEEAMKATGSGGSLRNKASLQSGEFEHIEQAMLMERPESMKEGAPVGEYWGKDEQTLKQLEARDQSFVNEYGIALGYQLNVDGHQVDRPGSHYGIERGSVTMTENKMEKILASHITTVQGEYMDLIRTTYAELAGNDKWCEGTRLADIVRETFRDLNTRILEVPPELEPVLEELKLCIDIPKKRTEVDRTGRSTRTAGGLIFLTSKVDEGLSLLEEAVRGMYATCRDKNERVDQATGFYYGIEKDVGCTYFMMAYEILHDIIEKIVMNPKDPHYRALRMSHRLLKKFIFDDEGMAGTKEVLLLTGWELCPQDRDVLMLPMEYKYTKEDLKVFRQRWIWSQNDARAEYKGKIESWSAMLARDGDVKNDKGKTTIDDNFQTKYKKGAQKQTGSTETESTT